MAVEENEEPVNEAPTKEQMKMAELEEGELVSEEELGEVPDIELGRGARVGCI